MRDMTGRLRYVALVQLSGVDRLYQGARVISAGAGHAQVETGAHRGDARAHGSPVAHNYTVKPPLAAKHIPQKSLVLGAIHAVKFVVRRHDAPWMRPANNALEGRQIQLA